MKKYFNFNYLKENIKKSRGIITLLFILIPVFTILTILLRYKNDGYARLLDIRDSSWINIIGSYIIPIGLSICLFGYVFKKKSVDFINSMPLNRKAIFITNTIAGIVLITLIQLITMIAVFILGSCISDLVIIPEMIFDFYLIMWIAHIFVFVTANLAMSFTGTAFTQGLVTIIILLIIPVCFSIYESISTSVNIEKIYSNNTQQITRNAFEEPQNYTYPANFLFHNGYEYSNESILKTVSLSIIYFGVGLYIFNKRKMENSEESFPNDRLHLIIKSLTILPMILFLNATKEETEVYIFAVGLIVIYYFAYDYIIRKKIKLAKSIFGLLLTLVICQGIGVGLKTFPIPSIDKMIDKENVKEISLELQAGNFYTSSDSYTENRKIIDYVFEYEDKYEEYYKYNENQYNENQYDENSIWENVCIKVKTKNGRDYNLFVYMLQEDCMKLFEMFENDEYVKTIKDEYKAKGFIVKDNHILENSEEISNKINNAIDNMTLKELYDLNISNSNFNIEKYLYKNHKLLSKNIELTMSKELIKEVADYENERLKNNYERLKKSQYGMAYYMSSGDLGYNQEVFDKFGYSGYLDMEDFVRNNLNEKIDVNQKVYFIQVTSGDEKFYLFTNKTEEIDEIIRKEIQKSIEEREDSILYID